MHIYMYTRTSFVYIFLLASDFDNTPIDVMILLGETMGTVFIPITNDTIVEGLERFDADFHLIATLV